MLKKGLFLLIILFVFTSDLLACTETIMIIGSQKCGIAKEYGGGSKALLLYAADKEFYILRINTYDNSRSLGAGFLIISLSICAAISPGVYYFLHRRHLKESAA